MVSSQSWSRLWFPVIIHGPWPFNDSDNLVQIVLDITIIIKDFDCFQSSIHDSGYFVAIIDAFKLFDGMWIWWRLSYGLLTSMIEIEPWNRLMTLNATTSQSIFMTLILHYELLFNISDSDSDVTPPPTFCRFTIRFWNTAVKKF